MAVGNLALWQRNQNDRARDGMGVRRRATTPRRLSPGKKLVLFLILEILTLSFASAVNSDQH
jgi:hypothetical protein